MSIQSMCSGAETVVPSGLRGYRYWNWADGGIGSIGGFGAWDGFTATAECRAHLRLLRETHDAPQRHCTCGIYGWYRPDEARLHQGAVFGVVEATGRVLLGDFGFRAASARCVALVINDRLLAESFRHDGVQVFATREALLAAYPPEDVRELIGHEIPDTPPPTLFPGHIMVNFGVSMQKAADAMKAVSDAFNAELTFKLGPIQSQTLRSHFGISEPLSDDPKTRALELRKRRHTGPAKPRMDGRR